MTDNQSISLVDKIIGANPLLPVTICLSAGIAIAHSTESFWIAAIATLCGCVCGIFKKTVTATWFIAFSLGNVIFLLHHPPEQKITDPQPNRYYEAEIVKSIENDNSQSATIEITHAGMSPDSMTACRPTTIRLTTPTFEPQLAPGHTLIFYGSIEPITIQTDLPDEWTPDEVFINQGISRKIFVEPDNIISIRETEGIIAYLIRCRKHLTEIIYQSKLSTQAKEFINTTLLGDASDLRQSTRKDFSQAGLSHVLALSGLHVGLIAMIISMALWPITFWGHRRTVTIIVIALLWCYAAIAGFGASVTRAVVMTTIYLTGRMLQRQTSAINSLCAAGLIILIISPESLFSIGFQLSFVAVLSIILFANRLNPFSKRRRIANAAMSYVTVSLSAMIGTALISTLYFHIFPIYFIVSNIVASILLPFILAGGVIVIGCAASGLECGIICDIVSQLCHLLDLSAKFIGNLPGASISNIYIPWWCSIIYASLLGSILLWISKRKPAYGVSSGILAVIFSGTIIFAPKPNKDPRLYLTRTTFRTDIIIDNASTVLTVATTRPQEPLNIRDRIDMRLRDFMGKRGIDSIRITGMDSASAPGFSICDKLINWGKKSIAIVDSKLPEMKRGADYAIVCRGFREGMADVIECVNPDTIILSYDLDPRRSKKYAEECKLTGVPVINLRDRPWNCPYRAD